MHFRSILSGTLAVLFVSGTAAFAAGIGQPTSSESGFSFHLPTINLPGVFSDKKTAPTQLAPAQMAQSSGAGVTELENQLRQMNGKIEELNFQVLQMQEQIRKQQEDNEFRLQQLEQGAPAGQKKSEAGAGNTSVAQAPVAAQPPAAGQPPADGQSVEDVIIDSGTGDPGTLVPGSGTAAAGAGATGAPAKTFGTITVDKNGNVVDAGGNTQSTTPFASGPAASSSDGGSQGAVVAALPATDNADELYRNSYQFILSGDYSTAEQGFRDHISRFPKDAKTADARYWLGESLLGQQKYRDAAEIFLAASKNYPKAKKAPDMLLKLGVSLVGLKQRDVACATFGEIGKRYPNVSGALKERIKQERALASC
ncbi:tol-pal system protein YbgF [Mesorhizobium sp. A623]